MPLTDEPKPKITGATVRADFNAVESVVHYARAAERVGLWASERKLIEQHFPDREAPLLEAGCGTGRVTLALAELGYTQIAAFDFAEELLEQAQHFATERGLARQIRFAHADATELTTADELCSLTDQGRVRHDGFAGVLFLFNGLMQIPGRAHRRSALSGLRTLARPGAPLLFTTHDRDDEPRERRHWKRQAKLWSEGKQDPALVDFGDRYFVDDDNYRVFMHLPSRSEILEDLAATGWAHEWDEMRRHIAREKKAVLDFSDECRFWLARRIRE
jgi:SAM-dependent methyltransferase